MHQETLYLASSKEHEAQIEYTRKQEHESFALTLDDELKAKERTASFRHFLNSMKATVKCLAQTYKSFVKNYLRSLSSSPNMNLQLLSVRLSFNDYYSVIWPLEREDDSYLKKCKRRSSDSKQIGLNDISSIIQSCSYTDSDLSNYGSIDTLLKPPKKKEKSIWCCVGWKSVHYWFSPVFIWVVHI